MLKGMEIAAYLDQITPWRHATKPSLDGISVRVVRVQTRYTFAARQPETVTVQWGGADRTRDVPELVDARTAWHKVTDGTTATGGVMYGSAVNVFEPDVYAVLPANLREQLYMAFSHVITHWIWPEAPASNKDACRISGMVPGRGRGRREVNTEWTSSARRRTATPTLGNDATVDTSAGERSDKAVSHDYRSRGLGSQRSTVR
jgi:hypothetical protein